MSTLSPLRQRGTATQTTTTLLTVSAAATVLSLGFSTAQVIPETVPAYVPVTLAIGLLGINLAALYRGYRSHAYGTNPRRTRSRSPLLQIGMSVGSPFLAAACWTTNGWLLFALTSLLVAVGCVLFALKDVPATMLSSAPSDGTKGSSESAPDQKHDRAPPRSNRRPEVARAAVIAGQQTLSNSSSVEVVTVNPPEQSSLERNAADQSSLKQNPSERSESISGVDLESVREELAAELGAGLEQRVTRRVQHGVETIEVEWVIRFAADEQHRSLHLPISPPLSGTPEVECEPVDGTEVELSVGAAHPYGIRIDARRAANESAEPAVATIGVLLRCQRSRLAA